MTARTPSSAQAKTKDWVIASSFAFGDDWIPSFTRADHHRFHPVAPHYRHDPYRVRTGWQEWKGFFAQGFAAWREARRHPRCGIVTVLPQLAIAVGLVKRLTGSRRPVVAWMFNLSRTYDGRKGVLARFALAGIDRFVVHSTAEITTYSRWLRLPPSRFVFVPLSVKENPVTFAEDEARPFVIAMGQANRDYGSLMAALAATHYRAVVVAPAHLLEGLEIPPQVEVRSNVPLAECHALVQQARISIVPLADTSTASGQVSVLDAMMFGRPVVATRSVGTQDYIRDGIDGVLVEPRDVVALRRALEALWDDAASRNRIAKAARDAALGQYTFRAVAPIFDAVLDDF